MNPTPKTPGWFLITRHWLSLLGVALVITACISSLFVAPPAVRGHVDNPYVGTLLLALPVIFFIGIALVAAGSFLARRDIREGIAEASVDRRAAVRRLVWFAGVTTVGNI